MPNVRDEENMSLINGLAEEFSVHIKTPARGWM